MKPPSTKQAIIRIATITALAGFLVLLAPRALPFQLNPDAEVLLHLSLLIILSTPAIYIQVIKPFVIARDEALAQIGHLAFTDPLTQLANRHQILKHLERVIASTVRHNIYGALIVIDLDGFKLINNDHGHDAGDAVLIDIAKRFLSSIRSEDIVGRLDSDEFVILVDRLDMDEQSAEDKALRIADKLISLTNIPFEYNGKSLHVGASIGICLLRFKHRDAKDVINRADIAAYRAKKTGTGCAIFSD